MINFSKTTLLSILLIIFVIIAGVFAYQWWQVKGELAKKIEQNENLIKQINGLQKEIEELKLRTADEVTITTDKTEYEQGEIVRIIIKNNSDEKIFAYLEGGEFREFPLCWLKLERFENGKWVSIEGSPCLYCPCGAMCEIPGVIYLRPGEIREGEWDQGIRWCEKNIEKRKNVSFGKYRLMFNYHEYKEGQWVSEREWKTIYSNAFMIK